VSDKWDVRDVDGRNAVILEAWFVESYYTFCLHSDGVEKGGFWNIFLGGD
jgi:hypothetical protein